jgi:hypothetical protein
MAELDADFYVTLVDNIDALHERLGHAFVMSRGNPRITAPSLYRLMFEPHRKRVYPSFPMTHVLDEPVVLAEIDRFRDALAERFITFDPADLNEKKLLYEAGEATKRGEEDLAINVNGRSITLPVSEITRVAHDIDAQIYARDFKLIEQSDMVIRRRTRGSARL